MPSTRSALPLSMLAVAAFVYNTSESFPVGALPQMSTSLRVSESQVGALLTVYAAVVAVTAIPFVVWTSHVARRRLVMITVLLLAASSLAIAASPNYELLLGARLLSATTHGIFWSMLAPTAAMLVSAERRGRATAVVFAGSSLALVAGTPLVSAVSSAVGWRAAAAGLGVVSIIAAAGLRATLPPLVSEADRSSGQWRPFVALLRARRLGLLCVATIFVVVGYFATYTYVSVFVLEYAGLTGAGLSMVLLFLGLAGVAAVAVIGKFNDEHPRASTGLCFSALAAALLMLGVFGSGLPSAWVVVIAVVLIGGAFTAVPVCLQAAVLRVAPGAGDIASSIYVVAFQVGIAGGSLAGGALLDGGLMDAVPYASAAAVAAALLLVLTATRTSRRPEAADAPGMQGTALSGRS
ncbi:MFS transporter [Clavibacter zhangzhiyongii]|uniref:MFS transporter n=1 Tax=Clavibacter zhangzhiyongii TaxID=2768071 RepID=UPI0039E1D260